MWLRQAIEICFEQRFSALYPSFCSVWYRIVESTLGWNKSMRTPSGSVEPNSNSSHRLGHERSIWSSRVLLVQCADKSAVVKSVCISPAIYTSQPHILKTTPRCPKLEVIQSLEHLSSRSLRLVLIPSSPKMLLNMVFLDTECTLNHSLRCFMPPFLPLVFFLCAVCAYVCQLPH
jgi:hypothetical protein